MSDAKAPRIGATAAKVLALGALACSACSALPFAVPAAMLAGSGSLFVWFAGAHPALTVMAVLTVATAWLWVGAQSLQKKR